MPMHAYIYTQSFTISVLPLCHVGNLVTVRKAVLTLYSGQTLARASSTANCAMGKDFEV